VVNDTVTVALACEFEGDDISDGYCQQVHGNKSFFFTENQEFNPKLFQMQKVHFSNLGDYNCVVCNRQGVVQPGIILNITSE